MTCWDCFWCCFFHIVLRLSELHKDHGLNQSDRDRRKSRQMERRQWGREKSEIIHGCTKRDRWRRSGFVVGEVCEAAVTERMKNGADQLLAAMFPRERRLGISSAVTLNASPPPVTGESVHVWRREWDKLNDINVRNDEINLFLNVVVFVCNIMVVSQLMCCKFSKESGGSSISVTISGITQRVSATVCLAYRRES